MIYQKSCLIRYLSMWSISLAETGPSVPTVLARFLEFNEPLGEHTQKTQHTSIQSEYLVVVQIQLR